MRSTEYNITPWTGAKLAARIALWAFGLLIAVAVMGTIASICVSTKNTFFVLLGIGLAIFTIIGLVASVMQEVLGPFKRSTTLSSS